MSGMRQRTLLAVAVLLALGFFILAEKAEDQAEENRWFALDLTAKSLIQNQRHPALEAPMRMLSYLGSGYVLVPLNAAVLLLLFRRQSGLAIFVPAITMGSTVAEGLTKWIVARPRPRLTGYGFPSGHVMVSVVFYGLLIYLLWKLVKSRLWRWVGTGLCVLVIVGVAYSRLYLNAHWLTDVLGGLAGGTASLLFAAAWADRRI